MTIFDFQPWKIETRKGRKPRVRWAVAGHKFGESFTTKGLAESFRAYLITTARNGEASDRHRPARIHGTNLPGHHLLPQAEEFTAPAWPRPGPDPRVHRRDPGQSRTCRRPGPAGDPTPTHSGAALRKKLNQGHYAGHAGPGRNEGHRLARAGPMPVSALEDPSVVSDVLDALALNLNGKPATPEYFSRRRRVLHQSPRLRRPQETAHPPTR